MYNSHKFFIFFVALDISYYNIIIFKIIIILLYLLLYYLIIIFYEILSLNNFNFRHLIRKLIFLLFYSFTFIFISARKVQVKSK